MKPCVMDVVLRGSHYIVRKSALFWIVNVKGMSYFALIEFKSKMPHRAEIIDSQYRMQEDGIESWLTEMKDYFSCPQCKTVNSAYHLACRNCGNAISSKFVSQHKDEIELYLSK